MQVPDHHFGVGAWPRRMVSEIGAESRRRHGNRAGYKSVDFLVTYMLGIPLGLRLPSPTPAVSGWDLLTDVA